MNELRFNLGQAVLIACSNEYGVIIGRAQYEASEPTYYVRYKAADGRAVEQWWAESALVSA